MLTFCSPPCLMIWILIRNWGIPVISKVEPGGETSNEYSLAKINMQEYVSQRWRDTCMPTLTLQFGLLDLKLDVGCTCVGKNYLPCNKTVQDNFE